MPSTVQRSAACSTKPSPARVCPRGSVPIMIRCSGSTAGRPICRSWRWKRCKRGPRFPGPIHLSNGSSGPSAGSIWIVDSFGRQMTWNEYWSCSKTSTTRLARTNGYPATRPGRKRAAQRLSQAALRITVGKAIATGSLNCQSPLESQFAMYAVGFAGVQQAVTSRLVGSVISNSIEGRSTRKSPLPGIKMRPAKTSANHERTGNARVEDISCSPYPPRG